MDSVDTSSTEVGPSLDVRPDVRSIELALVEISHRLVAGAAVDVESLLGILGEAMGAEALFLAIIDESPESATGRLALTRLLAWHSEGEQAAVELRDSLASESFIANADGAERPLSPTEPTPLGDSDILALPLLAESERFIGYLGIEHPAREVLATQHARALSIFADLLASHYGRLSAEQALKENQERWRTLMQLHPDPVIVATGSELLYVNRAATELFGASSPKEVVSYSLDAFLPAHLQKSFWRGIERQHRQKVAEPFEQEIIRLDGQERCVEVVSALTTFAGRPAAQTVLRDITERKASEEQYRTFVQTVSEGIWRVDLHEPLPIEADVAAQAEHILRDGVIGECNQTMAAWMGHEQGDRPIGKPLRKAFPDLPLYLLRAFVQSDYRLFNFELTIQPQDKPAQHFSVNAVGRLQRGKPINIWISFSDITARVEMERRMVAVLEEEQERIGRDLHDGVGQLLTGIRMLSENLTYRSSPALAPTVAKINQFSTEATERVRDICRGLAPPQLSQEPLALSLESLCLQLGAASPVTFVFKGDRDADVPDPDTKVQLFRIAQEAANNAIRHGEPERVEVRLRAEGDGVVLEIEDDGIGFDVDGQQHVSLGLYSMRRRASSVRARLTIESTSSVGTLVRATYDGPAPPPDTLSQ